MPRFRIVIVSTWRLNAEGAFASDAPSGAPARTMLAELARWESALRVPSARRA